MLLRQSLTAVAVALSPLLLSLTAYAEQPSTDVPLPNDADAGETSAVSDVSFDEGPSSDVVDPTCTTDDDCYPGDTCVDGYCQSTPGCVVDADCAPGDECVYEQCYAEGLFCNEQSDCGNYANCEKGPGGGIGKCVVDADTVPTYEACAEACDAAPCASLSVAHCHMVCNYAAANDQSAQVDALALCAVGKQCDQITAECAIGEDSVLFPGVFVPTGDTQPTEHVEPVEHAEPGPDASEGNGAPDEGTNEPEPTPDTSPTPDANAPTADVGPDATGNALELGNDAEEDGCAAGGSGNSLPMSLVLAVLALLAIVRSRGAATPSR